MRTVIFCHSIISDWNNGNAHFLRGIASELAERGGEVILFEPRDAWSIRNLIETEGRKPIAGFHRAYPRLEATRYDPGRLDLDQALEGASLVLVHEWNAPELVKRIGQHRARTRAYRLFFHDTHHRALTDPGAMSAYDLREYDGVLAFGEVLRQVYLKNGWARAAWTWHEAADVRVFQPLPETRKKHDLIWVGNWGDQERTAELHEFLLAPASALGLKTAVYGVRYPAEARAALAAHGISYCGWLPNYRVPEMFAHSRLTVHVPRRPYVRALRGIPTIRPFEAMACAIPLVCSPWEDCEGLFSPGRDYLLARGGAEMKRHLRDLINDEAMADEIARHGYETIVARHTCAHRVDQLMGILGELARATEEKESPACVPE